MHVSRGEKHRAALGEDQPLLSIFPYNLIVPVITVAASQRYAQPILGMLVWGFFSYYYL